MKLRCLHTDWEVRVAVFLTPVVVFGSGALLSRVMSSLHVANCFYSVWCTLTLLLVLGSPVWGLGVLLAKGKRKKIAMLVLTLTASLALSLIALRTLGYSRESALRALIETFDPVVAAVGRFERDHNRLPETLDELVPAYLSVIPTGQLVGDELKPIYRIESDPGVNATWWIEAGGYVYTIFDGPIGEVQYRSDQDYEGAQKEEARGRYNGWQWLVRP